MNDRYLKIEIIKTYKATFFYKADPSFDVQYELSKGSTFIEDAEKAIINDDDFVFESKKYNCEDFSVEGITKELIKRNTKRYDK